MTQLVVPSFDAEVTHQTASAISRWGGSDWIVPASEDIIASDVGLSGAPLNAAAITTSGLDVSIDTFEAFIDGAYVASDDDTDGEHTFTLPGNNTRTKLFLGYDYSAEDSLIFGRPAQFSSEDPRMVIGTFEDDGASITDTQDQRPVGYTQRPGTLVFSNYADDPTTGFTNATGTLSQAYDVYDIHIYRISHQPDETDQWIRINGSASNNYQQHFFDADTNSFGEITDASRWNNIAGTIDDTNGAGGFANQWLRLSCPRQITSNSRHYPQLTTLHAGTGFDVDHHHTGVFSSDTSEVDEITIGGGGNATGVVEIYGLGQPYR